MLFRPGKLSFVVLIIATLACNSLTRPATTSETPPPATVSASTSQPTSAVDEYKTAEGGGVSFQYPTRLIQDVEVVQVAAETDGPAPHPAYTQFALHGYPINSDTTPAQILVYPIAEFVDLVPSVAEDLKALKELKSYETDKLIPFPHILNANPIFEARRMGTFFPGTSGYLFLTQFGQDISPITNEGLTYVFIGQSENGLLIAAFFPVNAPGLPASFREADPGEWQNNFPEYIKGVKQQFLALQPGDFTPPLDVLENMVYSIAVRASSNSSNGLILGSSADTRRALDENIETLTKAAEEDYPSEITVGETRPYTIHVAAADTRLIWFQGWCTKNDNLLNQNLKNMRFELQVNGQSIDLDNQALSYYYSHSDGLPCFSYSMVMYGWESGATTITSKIIIVNPINDGISEYKAGEMTKVFTVIAP